MLLDLNSNDILGTYSQKRLVHFNPPYPDPHIFIKFIKQGDDRFGSEGLSVNPLMAEPFDLAEEDQYQSVDFVCLSVIMGLQYADSLVHAVDQLLIEQILVDDLKDIANV